MKFLAPFLILLFAWMGAFGIAWGVVEWRAGDTVATQEAEFPVAQQIGFPKTLIERCREVEDAYFDALTKPNVPAQNMTALYNWHEANCR